jgi:tetratricopeptide (TPR) repeat protein
LLPRRNRRARTLDRHHPGTSSRRASASGATGELQPTVDAYRKTIVLAEDENELDDPGRAIAHAKLGDAYLQLDRKRQAKRAYEKYLELAPTSRYATEVRAKLQKL